MAKTPEGDVVAYGRKQLTARGCLVRKIGYEMRRGCPDSLVLVPERQVIRGDRNWKRVVYAPCVIFIEYKATEDTQPEPHQVREHERMRAAGGDVRVVGSRAQVDALIAELFPGDR